MNYYLSNEINQIATNEKPTKNKGEWIIVEEWISKSVPKIYDKFWSNINFSWLS